MESNYTGAVAQDQARYAKTVDELRSHLKELPAELPLSWNGSECVVCVGRDGARYTAVVAFADDDDSGSEVASSEMPTGDNESYNVGEWLSALSRYSGQSLLSWDEWPCEVELGWDNVGWGGECLTIRAFNGKTELTKTYELCDADDDEDNEDQEDDS